MSDELHQAASAALQMAVDAGAADAVASCGQSESTEFSYRDGKLEQVQRSISRGLTVQLYVEGRYSMHHTSDLRPDSLRSFVADGVELTRHLAVDPARRIPDPALYAGRAQVDLDLVDPRVPALERSTCVGWLAGMDELIHEDSRVISATSSMDFGSHRSVRLSTNGFSGSQESTVVGYGSELNMDGGDGTRPEAYRFVRVRHLEDLPDPVSVAREALERGRRRLGSAGGASARTTMVVDAEAGVRLMAGLGEALSAGEIQQNRSCLAGKLGQTLAGPLLDLTDDPLRPRGLGSRLYDGEGIAARARPVIRDGVLRMYYVDTYYGRKLGWEPTTGSPSNVVFRLGEHGLEDLISQAGRGYYVTGWVGGNADMTTGDYSFGILGHRIENGRLGAPVSEMNVTGNYLDLLRGLVAVGNDPTPYSSLATPTLVFEGVDFSGR